MSVMIETKTMKMKEERFEKVVEWSWNSIIVLIISIFFFGAALGRFVGNLYGVSWGMELIPLIFALLLLLVSLNSRDRYWIKIK